MQLRLTLTTLVTILFMATACASEPAPPPRVPTNGDNDRLARQIQDLQDKNAAIREELTTLTAASQEQTQQQQAPTMETPIEPDLKPDQSIQNICERSPASQKALLSKLKLNRCSSVDGQELFRIEAISVAGDLKAGDLDGLVNLKKLNLVTEGETPSGIFADLVNLETLNVNAEGEPLPSNIFAGLGNLKALHMKISTDETWNLSGMLTGTTKLVTLEINTKSGTLDTSSPSQLNIREGDFAGLQTLDAITIYGVASLEGNPFAGLESLKSVTLYSSYPYDDSPSRYPTFPQGAFLNNPGIKSWKLHRFNSKEEMPMASLEQFCRLERDFGGDPQPKYHVNDERVSLISIDNRVCRVGVGEPGPNNIYPESQIKIVDRRPEATP